MATQSASGARDMSMNSKVAAPVTKQQGSSVGTGIRQPKVGPQSQGGTDSMPGSKGKGQMVSTVKSNPIQGKNVQGNTAMGNGGIVKGFV